MSAALQADIAGMLPFARAYARSLSRNATIADDVAQDAMLRAVVHARQFTPGTNVKAWIAAIVRNCYFDTLRSGRRADLIEFTDMHAPSTAASQEARIAFMECCRLVGRLPSEQQEALMLVAVEGLSYDEAAGVADCASGTIKSRVSRARDKLMALCAQ